MPTPNAPLAHSEPPVRRLPGWGRQVLLLLQKDLMIEVRSGEVVIASAFFAALVVVMVSFGFYAGPGQASQVAAGAIWVSIVFATVLALSRSWQHERDDRALDGLRVAPVSRTAVFAGKALGLLLFLGAIEAVVVLLCTVFFSIDLFRSGPLLLLVLLLTTPGLAACGTLFGAMTVRTRARDLMLSTVLFPLLAPVVLVAVGATRELLSGAPLSELAPQLLLLVIFDLIFIAGGLGLFATVLED